MRLQLYLAHLRLTCTPSPLYPHSSFMCIQCRYHPLPLHTLPASHFFFPLTHPHTCVNASPKLGLHVNVHPIVPTLLLIHTHMMCAYPPHSLSTPSTHSLTSFQWHFLSHSTSSHVLLMSGFLPLPIPTSRLMKI